MAKSRKQQGFVDPLDSIFGVIFGNAKSKPVKVKPRKLTGANASQQLARGLAEIAANPANYVGNGLNGLVGEYPNQINLIEFNYDRIDPKLRGGDPDAGRIRLRAGDVPSFLANPNKFIDSVFEKAKQERSMAKWLHVGRGMDSALMTVWAKQNGFSNKEAVTIGMASSNWMGMDQSNEARRKFAENIVLGTVSAKNDAAKLAKTSTFMDPAMVRGIQGAMEKARSKDFIRKPGELEQLLKTVPGLASRPDFDKLVKDIREEYGKKSVYVYGAGSDSIKGGSPWVTEGALNRDGYINILQQNLGYRAKLLTGSSDPKEMLEQRRLIQAQGALEAMIRLKGPGYEGNGLGSVMHDADAAIKRLEKDLMENKSDPVKSARIQEYIDKLTSQYNDAQKIQERENRVLNPFRSSLNGNFSRYKNAMLTQVDYELQKAKWEYSAAGGDLEKQAKAAYDIAFFENKRKGLKTMSGVEWRILLGDLQGAMGGLQATSALPANIMSGRFWNPDAQGALSPSTRGAVQILGKKGENIGWASGIVVPRGDISAGYAGLTAMYYLTPGSLFRTFLYNGEGFGYLKYIQRQGIARQLNASGFSKDLSKSLQALMASDEKFKSEISGFFKGENIDLDAFALNYQSFMDTLDPKKGDLTAVWGKLDELLKKDNASALTKLTTFFGTGNRALMRIQDRYNKSKFKDNINKFLVEKVIRKWLGDEVAGQLLAVGISKLGIRQMITMAVSEWAAGIGAAVGGPVGAVIGAAITYVATSFVESILKPFIKLFFAFLWAAIVVLISILAWIAIVAFQAAYPGPQQHIPPTDALECAAGNPFADLYKFEKKPDGTNLPDPDPNSTCPFHGSGYYCTQGDEPGSSAYHQARNSMDIGIRGVPSPIWYAPADGVVTSYSASNRCLDGADYGGAMIFKDGSGVEYHILHVQALATGSVKKGEPVAIVQMDLASSWCWTGPHFHLDVKVGGSFVDDTQHWYQEKLKCNIGLQDGTCH